MIDSRFDPPQTAPIHSQDFLMYGGKPYGWWFWLKQGKTWHPSNAAIYQCFKYNTLADFVCRTGDDHGWRLKAVKTQKL